MEIKIVSAEMLSYYYYHYQNDVFQHPDQLLQLLNIYPPNKVSLHGCYIFKT